MIKEIKSFFLFFYIAILPAITFSCDMGDNGQPSEDAPQVKTISVSNITPSSATAGGKITSAGGSDIEEKGVCWSTEGEPTIDDSKTSDGVGNSDFTSEITGLTANTTYYIRAYATNEFGTGYGDKATFKTEEQKIVYGANVKDIDGNEYKTIVIGAQTWMAENLKTTKYNDGKSIETTATNSDWNTLTNGGFCWYNNDVKNKDTYGAIYNWYAVNTGKLCPTGWHVATDKDWQTLSSNLGGTYLAGGLLKETGTTHWIDPNLATNETGFTALPGGTRNYFGSYDALGKTCYLWSSTVPADDNASYWQMSNEHTGLTTYKLNKASGFSVRCLRD
jgi:uncharacterized protein (TIGR02145 family)